jgi:hypothetical protein
MQGFKSFDGVDCKSTRFAVFPGNGEEPKASVASRASVSRASTRASKRHLGAALLGALHHGAGPSQRVREPSGIGVVVVVVVDPGSGPFEHYAVKVGVRARERASIWW